MTDPGGLGITRQRNTARATGDAQASVYAVEHGNQFNLPVLNIVIEHVGSVLEDMISRSSREKDQLQARVGRLKQQLKVEKARCDDLRSQSADLGLLVLHGEAKYVELQRQLESAANHARRYIDSLQRELDETRLALTQAAGSQTQLQDERKTLDGIEYALEGRALAQFERAEVAERENARLSERVASLQNLLSRYQQVSGE